LRGHGIMTDAHGRCRATDLPAALSAAPRGCRGAAERMVRVLPSSAMCPERSDEQITRIAPGVTTFCGARP
jgi:hypothetical protein